MKLIAHIYQQFDADRNREIPAENFGGWRTTQIEIAPQHTALVVMHAWDFSRAESYPGWLRVVEYIPRARHICETLFPDLLAAARASTLKVYHVVEQGTYYQHLPGYQRAQALAGPASDLPQVSPDPVYENLRSVNLSFGEHNSDDIRCAFADLDFAAQARPMHNEGVAECSEQLFALCREDGVNHLIYIGFAINWCLLLSPGGMADMRKHGLLCSTVRQAVTAVENRETARTELAKEQALWREALDFGFVFDADNIINALHKQVG